MSLSVTPAGEPDLVYERVSALLSQYNKETVGHAPRVAFALSVQEADSDEILGGLWAFSRWDSFYINVIFVPETSRGRGLGAEMMRQAEREARARGCQHIWLDTFAFQARAFYERLGFEVFGQLDGLAPYYPRYFMRKVLMDGSQATVAIPSVPG